jgi:lipopolysaccharide/colanic/teichoic acid biosynthesis glycosyltransferase
MDIFFSLSAFLLLLPVFFFVCILLMLANRETPFFTQLRPGRKERLFKVIKFKTMNDKRDELGQLLEDEARLTGVGRFIRKTSLDELPQLLNVIKGDMALVGPRPLLPEYLSLYNTHQRKRHDVRPGITGWAQVNGRNTLDWKKKFDLDVWYVDHLSFWLDMKIILLTFIRVFKAEGINSTTSATMEKFKGNL